MIRMLIWLLMLLGGGVLGYWLDRRWFNDLLFSPAFHIATFLAGMVLLRLVMRASRNTGRFLARQGREGELPRFETNRLVTGGYYACMRHPMHFGLLFFPLAVALILGSVSFIVIIAPVEMLLMITLIKLVEEPQALRKFGRNYEAYRRRVPMFSLRPECLKKLCSKSGGTD